MFKKPVWDDLSFVTWCIILLEVSIRRWVHCSHKGTDMVSNNRLWRLNDAQLVLRGPKCAKKISPTPLHHHHHQPEPLRQGRMLSCSYAKFFVVREYPSRSAVFEILRPARLAPTIIPRSKSLKSPFFPILMLGLNFSKSSSPHLDA